MIFCSEGNTPLDNDILYIMVHGFTWTEAQSRMKIGGIPLRSALFDKPVPLSRPKTSSDEKINLNLASYTEEILGHMSHMPWALYTDEK